jgi:16S rRNA pseudouridine516 synthase
MRLDKYISMCDVMSRSEAKKAIASSRVTVNGFLRKDAGFQVTPESTFVEVDGKPLIYKRFCYIMLNKPKGYVTATTDRDCPTVMDLLDDWCIRREMFPVGRLDKDTTGLLLITDDGGLCHDLTSPRRHVEKIYQAQIDKPVTQADINAFQNGMRFKEFVSELAKLEYLGQIAEDRYLAQVTLTEGKYHQVKRMFAARGINVLDLKRITFGKLVLPDNLPEGRWRELSLAEQKALKIKDPML